MLKDIVIFHVGVSEEYAVGIFFFFELAEHFELFVIKRIIPGARNSLRGIGAIDGCSFGNRVIDAHCFVFKVNGGPAKSKNLFAPKAEEQG